MEGYFFSSFFSSPASADPEGAGAELAPEPLASAEDAADGTISMDEETGSAGEETGSAEEAGVLSRTAWGPISSKLARYHPVEIKLSMWSTYG